MDDFGCPACGSLALAYPKALEDNEPVVCSGCAQFVSTYGEFKRRAEQALISFHTDVRVSGC